MTETCWIGGVRQDDPDGRRRELGQFQELPDGALLEAAQAGSSTAVWDLFCRHGGAVYALARLLTPHEEAAQEVVEDVFVSFQRGRGQLEDRTANVCLGLLAMARRRSSALTAVASHAGSVDSNHAIDEDCQARALMLLGDATLADAVQILAADRRVRA